MLYTFCSKRFLYLLIIIFLVSTLTVSKSLQKNNQPSFDRKLVRKDVIRQFRQSHPPQYWYHIVGVVLIIELIVCCSFICCVYCYYYFTLEARQEYKNTKQQKKVPKQQKAAQQQQKKNVQQQQKIAEINMSDSSCRIQKQFEQSMEQNKEENIKFLQQLRRKSNRAISSSKNNTQKQNKDN